MSKEEKNGEPTFEVKDKRRFRVGENGNVEAAPADQAPPETEGPTDTADAAPETAPEDAPKSEAKGTEEWQDQPPMTFITLVLSLSTQAMVNLGDLPDPVDKEQCQNLGSAKQLIDLLGVLDEKTKGNLSSEESQFLTSSLADLRIRYVERCKACKENK
jgi:Domain of unknown function (DUF1844)